MRPFSSRGSTGIYQAVQCLESNQEYTKYAYKRTCLLRTSLSKEDIKRRVDEEYEEDDKLQREVHFESDEDHQQFVYVCTIKVCAKFVCVCTIKVCAKKRE